MGNYLIYGANGYTGRLIAREAVVRGHRPVLAGRSEDAVQPLAKELGLACRIFPLDDPAALRAGVQGVDAVLHCAGPFAHTARPMADACLEAHVHYLDITGEIAVFEMLASREPEALAAGILFLPGVGFDVVPTDCLAAHLKRKLPTADRLALGIQNLGRMSRGTATTIVEGLPRGGAARQGGRLISVPPAWKVRTLDLGRGPIEAMTIPWGDVSTAYHSTGIPNIEVYLAASRRLLFWTRVSRYFSWLLRWERVQRFLKARARKGPAGPSEEERARGETLVWGEVTDPAGRRAAARLRGPEGYTFTARSAVAAMEKVLTGRAHPGFQTPSLAFGPDFVLQLPDVVRTEEE
jgi:short subunit dehydrogenase-like uncharacterized protein